MVYSSSSRGHKRAALYEKLQLLRSVTNSHAVNNTSIIIDASKYIEDLKEKVEKLNQDIAATAQNNNSSALQNPLPVVTVETLKTKGFLVNVFSKKSCPGLLVSILEAFEELGLNVLEARVSCADTFCLEAVGGGGGGGEDIDEGQSSSSSSSSIDQSIDAQVVKQAVLQAIKNWSTTDETSCSE